MAKKKTIRQKATTRVKNKSKDPNVEPYHLRRGIESKLGLVPEFFQEWGRDYCSISRKVLNQFQLGATKKDLSPILQKQHNVQWAWIDSLLTDVQGTFEQLKASKDNRIEELKADIKPGKERASDMIEEVQNSLEYPTKKNIKGIPKKLRGIKSKLKKNQNNQAKLEKLESTKRLHICFGSQKLFNAQYHLKENGYKSREEWLADWRKSRSGNIYSLRQRFYRRK
ncbi:hypothetical protein [Calothrix sp. CCY 0018]|uniref:hypothetical protein n=1 Tax=Calothrix sp. CCY 0018 TaxID=3103864 RepID=UPI0039C5E09E